jgi:penicillin-binding protein 1B
VKRPLTLALFGGCCIVLFALPPFLYSFFSYYHALKNEVIRRFSGQRWSIPSRIYSDSKLIYPGMDLDAVGFFQRLARLNYHPIGSGEPERGEYVYDRSRGRVVIFLHRFAYPYRDFPGDMIELVLKGNELVAMRDVGSGRPTFSMQLEPELLSGVFQGSWEQRRLVRLSQIPPAMIDAILAAEDHRFYEHHGIDALRILKAAYVDLISGHVRQGGSTLTQQLMKNFFLNDQRTYKRKLKEALMAYIAERLYSKDEILENYVNDIYLGQRGQEGIYGVWEASEYYFSKDPRYLTLGEMATIAGMISSPNRLNPLRYADLVRARRNEVLGLMVEDGYISRAAYDSAAMEPLRPRQTFTETDDAPYFVDYVKDELAARYPSSVLTGEGLRIFTTLDVHTEKLAEKAVAENLDQLEARYPRLRRKEETDRLESALVAIEPPTGKIRAMVGGRAYSQSQFNRITQARRQPGSVFKPVTYLAALNETLEGGPQQFLPTSLIDDEPFTWEYGDKSWTPRNYDDRYFGRVTLQFALQESLNSATARLANAIGLVRVRAMAAELGFGELPAYPSIVLGGIEVTPMQIAEAYAVCANEGQQAPTYAVTAVVDQNGRLIQGSELKTTQLLTPQLAFMLDFMLEDVINRGTGIGVHRLGFLRPAAGKTGTTNESKDAWFAGFTPNLLAVVWTGFDQKEVLNLTGAEASLPAWTIFMKAATASLPELNFLVPPGIAIESVDPLTGYKGGPYCPVTVLGVFPLALAPTETCPFHTASSKKTSKPKAPDIYVPEVPTD